MSKLTEALVALTIQIEELQMENAKLRETERRYNEALVKIADWHGAWGPFPENNEAWRAMAIVAAREAVPLSENFIGNPYTAPVPQATYSSAQATNCAQCGEHKHTPLRIDAMGGYVCLTCIDKKLGSILGEFGYAAPVPRTDDRSGFAVPHQITEEMVTIAVDRHSRALLAGLTSTKAMRRALDAAWLAAAPKQEAPLCKGENCTAAAGEIHSPECMAEHDAAVHFGAGNRHPEDRYRGYSNQPMNCKDADRQAAWREGRRAAERLAGDPKQEGV